MYTIFSMLVVFLISPFSWIVVLLFVALVSKKTKLKKRAALSAFIIIIVFSNPFLLHTFARFWNIDPAPLQKGKVYSAAIVLGGFTNEDRNGNGFFTEHSDRLIETMRLKEDGTVSHIMISGGNSDPNPDHFRESEYVQKVLHEFNFPDSVILTEQKSRNTAENAVYTRQVFNSSHLKPPYLLVTSAFHMRRAMYLFKKNGMDVLPYPCDYFAGNTKLWAIDYFVPSVNVFYNWHLYLKEVFGWAGAHFK